MSGKVNSVLYNFGVSSYNTSYQLFGLVFDARVEHEVNKQDNTLISYAASFGLSSIARVCGSVISIVVVYFGFEQPLD